MLVSNFWCFWVAFGKFLENVKFILYMDLTIVLNYNAFKYQYNSYQI